MRSEAPVAAQSRKLASDAIVPETPARGGGRRGGYGFIGDRNERGGTFCHRTCIDRHFSSYQAGSRTDQGRSFARTEPEVV